jgi:hypothetical protein
MAFSPLALFFLARAAPDFTPADPAEGDPAHRLPARRDL